MAERYNPLKLNKLQLKTLTLLQELASSPQTSTHNAETGEAMITLLPQAHGNHFHIGSRIVMTRDATGLSNEAVWRALARKGLAYENFPIAITLTREGLAYETRMRDAILLGSDH